MSLEKLGEILFKKLTVAFILAINLTTASAKISQMRLSVSVSEALTTTG